METKFSGFTEKRTLELILTALFQERDALNRQINTITESLQNINSDHRHLIIRNNGFVRHCTICGKEGHNRLTCKKVK